jgi:translation initiation factor 1
MTSLQRSKVPVQAQKDGATPPPRPRRAGRWFRCGWLYFARTTIVPPVRVDVVVVNMAKLRNMMTASTLLPRFHARKDALRALLERPMAKRSDKKKIEVHEAGSGHELKHNAFGALGGLNASEAKPAREPPPTPTAKPEPKSRGRLVLRREKKQRGGKTVVIVAGLRASAHLAESEIEKLAKHLKEQLGCGGSVERVTNDTEIVIQGDHPARVAELLRAKSFRVDGVTG